ncbi:hypothetical protein AN958_08346 [Leucoagaricus sp. SymC.cos]|nr:hypothetical protein AN958_08346 [Leucoagaricus sp. SymC.cos]
MLCAMVKSGGKRYTARSSQAGRIPLIVGSDDGRRHKWMRTLHTVTRRKNFLNQNIFEGELIQLPRH